MPGMGPPPKPPGTRARRNATPSTTKLSAQGRAGKKAPAWPLRADAAAMRLKFAAEARVERLREQINETSDRRKVGRLERQLDSVLADADAVEAEIAEQAAQERELWDELWKTPQAAMWEKLAWSREVAQYVRFKIKAEAGDLDAAKEARQWSDRLGLNPLAMLRLRWEIERTDEAEQKGRQRRQRGAGAEGKSPAKKGAKPADPRAFLRAVN